MTNGMVLYQTKYNTLLGTVSFNETLYELNTLDKYGFVMFSTIFFLIMFFLAISANDN